MKTYAVTSGKGGVGKTNIAANLGISLAARGNRVLLFDADLGLANLDIVLGTKTARTLQNVLAGEVSFRDAICRGPGGVSLLAGGSGIEDLVTISGPHLERFIGSLAELESTLDYLLFDTGAGIDNSVMTFLQAADEVLLVTTPDPSSLSDAYAVIKSLWARKPGASISLVMNMVADETEAKSVATKLAAVCTSFLERAPELIGYVRNDPRAIAHIRSRQPFVLADPSLPASVDIAALSLKLIGERKLGSQEGVSSRFKSLLGPRFRESA